MTRSPRPRPPRAAVPAAGRQAATVRRMHRMPFGAEPAPGGRTRFALWAPAAAQVEVWLEDTQRAVATSRDADGWATAVVDAPPGTRYRFRIDQGQLVPDPASRFQPTDVHGPSVVVDPLAHEWRDGGWRGRPAEELVFYELHVGTFTPEGTFQAAITRLDHLAELGVTAVELMPVADFPGRWGWGYDGVLPFAPDARYGTPEDLKALVDACHARGLAAFLDVVYNHFGPEGNYLGLYAPGVTSRRHRTPWGEAMNFDGPGCTVVRQFVVHNALYWIEEFSLDGLRLDAVHAIHDESEPHILAEIARAVASGPGARRPVHLILENDANEARWLARPAAGGDPAAAPLYRAQWNDDVHHALHVLITGERGGYYADYAPPAPALLRCLTEGFAYQGDWSAYRGHHRGESSRSLPPTAFVAFLQNHDQVGNRALGERIGGVAEPEALRAATLVLLLAPALPLLFMGQEWAALEPFLFFSDLGPDLGPLVSEGRRREFERFPEFADAVARDRIPDPQAPETRARSILDWTALEREPHRQWLGFHRTLLNARRQHLVPLLAGEGAPTARGRTIGETGVEARWRFSGGRTLTLVANLGREPVPHTGPDPAWGPRLAAVGFAGDRWEALPPWSAAAYLGEDASR